MVVRAVLASLVATGMTCGLLAALLWWATGRVANHRAIEQARQRGEVDALVVFTPFVTDAVLDGDADARSHLTRVAERYLQASGGIRVKVWDDRHRVVYSDEPQLIGRAYSFRASDEAAFSRGETVARVSDLSKPENAFEQANEELLEVYVPAATESGRPIVVETYYPYRVVERSARAIHHHFGPTVMGAVGALALLQLPAYTLVLVRLQRTRRQRTLLMERLLDVSDSERRRVAGEVHDGAVQDLIGLTYALGGVAERAPAADSVRLQALSEELTGVVHRLRDLLTTIYPAPRANGRPHEALEAMVAAVRARGIHVVLDVPDDLVLPQAHEAVVLRTVQELTRNIANHSHATTATIRLQQRRDTVVLTVTDDGVGFDPALLEAGGRPGHFGLRLLADLAADSGGSFTITTEPGHGTRAVMQLEAHG